MPIFLQAPASIFPLTEFLAVGGAIVTALCATVTVLWKRSEAGYARELAEKDARLAEKDARLADRTRALQAAALELQKQANRNDDLTERFEAVAKDNADLREEGAVMRTRLERFDIVASQQAPRHLPPPPSSSQARTPTLPSMRLPPIPDKQ